MKRLLLLLVFGLFALLQFNGCQSYSRKKSGVVVLIKGGGEFPQSLAGRWKADQYGWEFVFGPDGNILSAVVAFGGYEIIPGQTKTVPLKEGGKGIYKPGLWTVQYSPSTRELVVDIVMDYIHFETRPHLLEGKSRDVFVGEVSKNGKTWQAEWFSFPDYIAYIPEPKKLTVDPNESLAATLTFEKLEQPR